MSVVHCFTCRRIAKLMLFCTQNILESISKATSLLCFKFFASLAFKSQLLLCWMIILQHLTAAWYFSSSLDCIHVLSQFMLALQTHRQKSLTFVQPHPAVPGLNSKSHCNTVKKKPLKYYFPWDLTILLWPLCARQIWRGWKPIL